MGDTFLQLSPGDRREALVVAAASTGRPVHLLDKDVWLVWILEKNAGGEWIDYVAAVSGGLRLVPGDHALMGLSLDYAGMLDDGLLLDDAEPLEEVLDQCRDLESRANKPRL